MCGFAGYLSTKDRFEPAAELKAMLAPIEHRGPDAEGTWFDREAGIALGHRRLSILDLSPQGNQPMVSACGRYVIVFNGEVYNHLALKQELEAGGGQIAWRGHSDTEVMLAAIARWGLEPALEKFTGMFAFALWDRQARQLHLARDRIGEKPLYYGLCGDTLLFGSELKALRAHSAWNSGIDRDALALYLRHNYVPAPYTIHAGIFKLLPGHLLSLKAEHVATGHLPEPAAYWSARRIAAEGAARPLQLGDAEAADALEKLLGEAIGRQMVADVPLGAFLSGGVDSSTVVALMQAQSARPVKTFTIGFDEAGYNEADHAAAVARHLGTEHTELYVTSTQALDVIPRLPRIYDEPFADSSQIPTFLVAEMTRRHVKVSLSGDGGDELFGGYNRYTWGNSLWRRTGRLPAPLRRLASNSLLAVKPERWDLAYGCVRPLLPEKWRMRTVGNKLHKLGSILAATTPEALYLRLISHWDAPESIVKGGRERFSVLGQWPQAGELYQRMMFLDLLNYLPDDILVKVDRAAMAVSLETRVPMLDHHVVEFAWALPTSLKIRNGQGKWLLRQVLDRHVPRQLIERPKMGFGIPLEAWLRGPLRDWAENLLAPGRLEREGCFHAAPIRAKWDEHLRGERNWAYDLWSILMFEAWLEHSGCN